MYKNLPKQTIRMILFEMVKRNYQINWNWETWSHIAHHCGLNPERGFKQYWGDSSPIHFEGVCVLCNMKLRYPDGTRTPLCFGCGYCHTNPKNLGKIGSPLLHTTIAFSCWSKENRNLLMRHLQNGKRNQRDDK